MMNSPGLFEARHIISACTPGREASAQELLLSHKHERREMLCVIEGTSTYMFNNRMYAAVPGTVFLIDQWCPHTTGYTEQDHDLLHLWLYLDPPADITVSPIRVTSCGEYSLRSPSFRLPAEYGLLLDKRWNMAFRHQDNNDQATVERLIREPVNALLDEISLHLQFLDSPQDSLSTDTDAIIDNIWKYIRTNHGRGCSLEHLEKLSGYSRFYLSHRFKLATGKTIGQFISEVRQAYTAAALRRGLRQKEIAAELGFSSPSNFWNWYRKHKN